MTARAHFHWHFHYQLEAPIKAGRPKLTTCVVGIICRASIAGLIVEVALVTANIRTLTQKHKQHDRAASHFGVLVPYFQLQVLEFVVCKPHAGF